MSDTDTRSKTRAKPKVERPKMYKVVLLNDDFTPRAFVVKVLKAEFGLGEDRANDMARQAGYPLRFSTEPEE
jgi:ATP-dependent Clp protease adaptor protein ClpS